MPEQEFSQVFTQNENIDPLAEKAVAHIIGSVFDKAVYIDPVIVRYNIGLASEGGMQKLDRSMRLERANYLMSHFAHIFVGLVVDKYMRDAFYTAVQTEIAFDDFSAHDQEELRKTMYMPPKKPSKGAYVIDLSKYNDKYFKLISSKLLDSFDKFHDYNDVITQAVSEMSVHDRLTVGYCVSNFAYLFRAFARNDAFMTYVKTTLKGAEKSLGI